MREVDSAGHPPKSQFSILFLTGWVALVVAGKITVNSNTAAQIVACCLAHIISICLAGYVQWQMMKLYKNRSEDLLKIQEDNANATVSVINRINQRRDITDNYFQDLEAFANQNYQPILNNDSTSLLSYNIANSRIWRIGAWALLTSVLGVVLSLYVCFAALHKFGNTENNFIPFYQTSG